MTTIRRSLSAPALHGRFESSNAADVHVTQDTPAPRLANQRPKRQKSFFEQLFRIAQPSSSGEAFSSTQQTLKPHSFGPGYTSSPSRQQSMVNLEVPHHYGALNSSQQTLKQKGSFLNQLIDRVRKKSGALSAKTSDIDNAVKQLLSPTSRKNLEPRDFTVAVDRMALTINPNSCMPRGSKPTQETLDQWEVEVIKALNALNEVEKNKARHDLPALQASSVQLEHAKDVIQNMKKVFAGNMDYDKGMCWHPSSENIVISVSHEKKIQAIAHVRIDKGIVYIEGIISNPRNIFDLEGRGGIKGAARTAIEAIKQNAGKCSLIELTSLSEQSTLFYRKNGFEKEHDYIADDDGPTMIYRLQN